MIPVHMEPKGLHRETEPLADFRAMAYRKTDAERGSDRLRNAIMGIAIREVRRKELARRPRPKRKSEEPRKYGTVEDRLLAASQIARLQERVADFYGVSRKDILGSRGDRGVLEPRFVATYLAREIIQSSLTDIAREFGGKDHTTIRNAILAVQRTDHLMADAAEIRLWLRS